MQEYSERSWMNWLAAMGFPIAAPWGETGGLTPTAQVEDVTHASRLKCYKMMNFEHGISNIEVLVRNIGTSSFIIPCSTFDILPLVAADRPR